MIVKKRCYETKSFDETSEFCNRCVVIIGHVEIIHLAKGTNASKIVSMENMQSV